MTFRATVTEISPCNINTRPLLTKYYAGEALKSKYVQQFAQVSVCERCTYIIDVAVLSAMAVACTVCHKKSSIRRQVALLRSPRPKFHPTRGPKWTNQPFI